MGAQPAGFLRDCWRETQFVVWTKRAGDSSNSSALAIKSSAIISNRSARCLSSHSSARRVHTRAWRRKAATKIKGLSFYRDDAAERQSRGRGATRQIAICCNCGATAQEPIDEMGVEYVQEHNLRSESHHLPLAPPNRLRARLLLVPRIPGWACQHGLSRVSPLP
jgi:hypothetical protein